MLAYFGQVNRWKGIDLILEAFAVVVKKHPSLRLELHGFSPDLLTKSQTFMILIFLILAVAGLMPCLNLLFVVWGSMNRMNFTCVCRVSMLS